MMVRSYDVRDVVTRLRDANRFGTVTSWNDVARGYTRFFFGNGVTVSVDNATMATFTCETAAAYISKRVENKMKPDTKTAARTISMKDMHGRGCTCVECKPRDCGIFKMQVAQERIAKLEGELAAAQERELAGVRARASDLDSRLRKTWDKELHAPNPNISTQRAALCSAKSGEEERKLREQWDAASHGGVRWAGDLCGLCGCGLLVEDPLHFGKLMCSVCAPKDHPRPPEYESLSDSVKREVAAARQKLWLAKGFGLDPISEEYRKLDSSLSDRLNMAGRPWPRTSQKTIEQALDDAAKALGLDLGPLEPMQPMLKSKPPPGPLERVLQPMLDWKPMSAQGLTGGPDRIIAPIELLEMYERRSAHAKAEDGPGIAKLPKKPAPPDFTGWADEWDCLPDAE